MYVVVGEALVDLVAQRGGRTFVAHPGGSPANVALGLARLGGQVSLTTQLGDDAFGHMITSHLEASGVVVDAVPDPRGHTSLAIATLAAGVASYDFRIAWDVQHLPPLPVEARCLHTGSLAAALPPGDRAVLDLVRRERERGRVLVSYDPNVRPTLLGSARRAQTGIERLVALADVVKVSDEDLRWLYPGEKDQDVAGRWLAAGPALVCHHPGRPGGVRGQPGPAGDTPGRTRGHGRHRRSGRLLHLRPARRAPPRGPARRRPPGGAGDNRRGHTGQHPRPGRPDRSDHLLPNRHRPTHPRRGRHRGRSAALTRSSAARAPAPA